MRIFSGASSPTCSAGGAPRYPSPPYRLEDSAWVANRLCELLPLPMERKQELMCTSDPTQRLAWIDRWLEEQEGFQQA